MKKILCFGDSNTYGFNPLDGSRYDKDTRWSGILGQKLSFEYLTIEAGCCNRTCFQEKETEELVGCRAILKYLTKDLDFIILSLGINDTQKLYNTTLKDFEQGMTKLIKIIKNNSPETKILILSPSTINNKILKSFFKTFFDENSIEISKHIKETYKTVANAQGCDFLDLDKIAKTSQVDGLHYMPSEHKKIANELLGYFIQ